MRRPAHFAILGALIHALFGFAPGAATAQQLPVVRVAFVIDGPWEGNDAVRSLFEQEMRDITAGEFDVRFPEDKRVVGDWSAGTVTAAVDRLLADPGVDFIITLGVLASNYVSKIGDLPKPVIAPTVIDAQVQALPDKDGTTGVKNLNYVVFPNNILRDVKAFLEIITFRKMAMLVNANIRSALPEITPRLERILGELEVEVQVITVGQSVDEALSRLDADVEAVYVAPLLHLPPGEADALIRGLIQRKLPSFSLFGRSEVERGILASLSGEIFPRLSRRVALNFQRILLGEDAASLPTAFSAKEQLSINMTTARAIGVYPDWGVLTDAVLIGEAKRDITRRLTLERAVQDAIDANLQLAATEKSVEAAAQDIKRAESELWPQIDLSLLGVQIDQDQAESSAGQVAERELRGGFRLSQILYAEPAWANVAIQKHLQRARERDRDAFRLDIVQESATAYLDVLRAKTFERIQKENLTRTRENLDLAEIRRSVGTADRSEVLRWESEIANNRKAVIDANALRNVAEIQLNRILQRPSEEEFLTAETGLDDSLLLLPQGQLTRYIGNRWDFQVFRRFMVKEGLESTPEIQALEDAIAAQQRLVASTGRSFWLPTLGLFADVNNVFSRSGTGADGVTLPPPLDQVFRPPEDLRWSVAVELSYPLFTGGGRRAERRQATAALAELRLQLQSTSEIIEQRIRSALHIAGAAYAGINQSRLAAAAARETLELVEDAYARGAESIVRLLDAQNNALIAEENAATAVYDYLIDMMEVERSIGKLVIEMSVEERREFFERLDAFFSQNR